MSAMSFSLAITSLSSLARASGVSVALLNSNSSVEERFTIAGFFGSGFGAGSAARGAGTGAGGGAAGAGGGAGFGSSVAQPAMTIAMLLKAAVNSARVKLNITQLDVNLTDSPLFCRSRPLNLSTVQRVETSRFSSENRRLHDNRARAA